MVCADGVGANGFREDHLGSSASETCGKVPSSTTPRPPNRTCRLQPVWGGKGRHQLRMGCDFGAFYRSAHTSLERFLIATEGFEGRGMFVSWRIEVCWNEGCRVESWRAVTSERDREASRLRTKIRYFRLESWCEKHELSWRALFNRRGKNHEKRLCIERVDLNVVRQRRIEARKISLEDWKGRRSEEASRMDTHSPV